MTLQEVKSKYEGKRVSKSGQVFKVGDIRPIKVGGQFKISVSITPPGPSTPISVSVEELEREFEVV